MNDGIIVARIEPDNSLEIITLSGNSGEAIRQIAEIMGYPPHDPPRPQSGAVAHHPR